MNEFSPEFGVPHEQGYEVGMAGESPLNEILAQEAPMHESAFETPTQEEGAFQEGPYHEAGYQESPYQETTFHEAAYQEAPYQEAPFHESAYQEAPFHEAAMHESVYQEAPFHETGAFGLQAGEYQEGAWQELLSEDEELSLAAEVLEIQSEDEVDRFLGKLIRRVSRAARGFVRSPLGRMLGGVLKRVAKVALPLAGKALGGFVGGPAGAMIGGKLASFAGQAMGLELQEMSGQDADFATARQFVRLASEMIRRAQASPPGANPTAVVRQAVTGAAQQLAPGLLSRRLPRVPVGPVGGRQRGVWVRRGRTITLLGV